MAYLLPAGSAPRTKNKWGLGIITSQLLRVGPFTNGGSVPLPQPAPAQYRGPFPSPFPIGPVGVRPIVYPSPTPNPPMPGPLPVAPNPPPDTNTSGSPVPSGFPTNQFYVAPDGSVWEYSVSGNRWFNTGTPYNVNAPGGGATAPTPASTTDSTASQPPVSVTVSTPATESGYQSVLDWLTQQTLISGFPNWVLLAGGALAYKMFFASSSAKGR